MRNRILDQAKEYLLRNRQQKRWRRGVSFMACVVACCVACLLMVPARTLEKETFCGSVEHSHSEECYENTIAESYMEMICCTEGKVAHAHGELCFDAEGVLICTLPELEEHIHTDDCYTAINDVKLQSSGIEEGEPPADEGSEEPPVDEGGEEPPVDEGGEEPPVDEDEEGVPVDEDEEGAPADGDGEQPTGEVTESEIEIRKELTCNKEELVLHNHEEGCFRLVEIPGEPILTCEMEVHTHSLGCYSNPYADLETMDDWEKTLLGVEITGDWSEDLIAVAETQLGYRESTANYVVLEDGETMNGYTRYGEWYGSPYGDWCAMYISFCLFYAGIDAMPQEAGCQNWILKLQEEEFDLYREREEYIPVRGDLVFFNNDELEDADHVAIVLEVTEEADEEPAQIKTIEGNYADSVCYRSYALDDASIMGYGQLPEEPMEYFCGYEEHIHEDACMDEDGALICAYEEHVHDDSCLMGIAEGEATTLELTPESAAPEGSGLGDKYHRKDALYYQRSSHSLDVGSVVCFMLVPISERDTNLNQLYPKPWSASVASNYVCAYCSDLKTYSSSEGADYYTYTIDNSRFTSQEVKDTLSGIIAHAYPFLTEAEMKEELAKACAAGEITQNVTDCTPDEFLVAAQWAIWETTTLAEDERPTKASGTNGDINDCFNPLTEKGHSNDTTINTHVKAIKDWLISRGKNEELKIADYIVEISYNPDGSYDLIVNASLNREITEDETATTYLEIGGLKSDETILTSGTQEFTLRLENLKDEDLATAKAYFTVTGQHMQAYFYDSENYQDLIGGKWEKYSENLSFDIRTDFTSVAVTKTWAETTRALDSVEVQLYANEKPYGDPVILTAADEWTYTWNNLLREDAWGNPITYTVREKPVDGYISDVEVVEGTADTIYVWEKVEGVPTESGQYLLVTQNGAIKEHVFKGANHYTYAKVDVTDASVTDDAMIWKFTANNGGFKIQNKEFGKYIGIKSNAFTPQKGATIMYFTDKGELYYKASNWYGSTSYYFSLLNTEGNGVRTEDTENAAKFTLYKLTEKELPPSETNYVITNSKISGSAVIAKTISVQKNWAGRSDGAHPSSATVTLLQNGQPYGDSVVLNESNDWSHQWENMPVKIGDQAVSYEIREVAVEGYAATVENTEDDDSIAYNVTNTRIAVEVDVELAKVDSNDSSKLLEGAKFDVYRLAHDGESSVTIPGTENTQGILEQPEVGVGEDGKVKITLETQEVYYLVETSAPNGYYLLSAPIAFKVTEDNAEYAVDVLTDSEWAYAEEGTEPVVYIKNEMSYRLPETGGGTLLGCYAAGVILTAGAAVVLSDKKKHK